MSDDMISEMRRLREAGHGGIHHCGQMIKGKHLREKLQNAETLDEVKEVVLALIKQAYPQYPEN